MELICPWSVHIEKGLVKTITNILQGTDTERQKDTLFSLRERVQITGYKSHKKGLEEVTSSLSVLGRDS